MNGAMERLHLVWREFVNDHTDVAIIFVYSDRFFLVTEEAVIDKKGKNLIIVKVLWKVSDSDPV